MKRIIYMFLLVFVTAIPTYAQNYELDGNTLFNQTAKSVTDGTFTLNPIELINTFFESFFYEIKNTKSLLITILAVCALAAVLKILASSFETSKTAETAGIACFLLISLCAVKIFAEVSGLASAAIREICDFITKFEPVLMMSLISCGAVTQAAAFQPLLAAGVYITGILFDKCIMPLCYFSALLGICSNVGGRIELGNMTKLISSLSKWLLTSILTMFTAILSLYGFSTKAFNSVATKGLKLAVGSIVPVVGGILSDTLESVLTGANLIKSAVGTAGVIAILSVIFAPCLKILIMMLLLKAVAAIIEPFSEKRTTEMLICVSDSVKMMFAAVASSSLLFIISIAIILLSSGVSL